MDAPAPRPAPSAAVRDARATAVRLRYEARQHREQRKRLLALSRTDPDLVQRLWWRSAAAERLRLAKAADEERKALVGAR